MTVQFTWKGKLLGRAHGTAWTGATEDELQTALVERKDGSWVATVTCKVTHASYDSGPFRTAEHARQWAQITADECRDGQKPTITPSLLSAAITQAARLLEAVDRFKETRSSAYETLMFERADELRIALGHHLDKKGAV